MFKPSASTRSKTGARRPQQQSRAVPVAPAAGASPHMPHRSHQGSRRLAPPARGNRKYLQLGSPQRGQRYIGPDSSPPTTFYMLIGGSDGRHREHAHRAPYKLPRLANWTWQRPGWPHALHSPTLRRKATPNLPVLAGMHFAADRTFHTLLSGSCTALAQALTAQNAKTLHHGRSHSATRRAEDWLP